MDRTEEDRKARRTLLIILIVVSIIAYVVLSFIADKVAHGAGPEVDGFGTLKWGNHPKKEMELLDRRGAYSFYAYEDGTKVVGLFDTERVSYKFCNDGFCGFAGAIKGDFDKFNEISNLFIVYYGPPTMYHPYNWIWTGETDVMLFYDDKDKMCCYYFHYNPPHEEIDHARAKAIEDKRKKEGKPPLKSLKQKRL
jgi:hypothetical protein